MSLALERTGAIPYRVVECNTPGCDRPVFIRKRGLCRICYGRDWAERNRDKVLTYRERTNAKRDPTPTHTLTCAWCGEDFEVVGNWVNRAKFCSPQCCDKARLERDKSDPRRKAKSIHQGHRRRLAKQDTDLTAVDVARLVSKAKRCPLCRCWLRGTHPDPRSPQLDHIVPLNQGGTHTYANVRVICARCNQARPKDGSDFAGQLGLGSMR